VAAEFHVTAGGEKTAEMRYALRKDIDPLCGLLRARGLVPDRIILADEAFVVDLKTQKSQKLQLARKIQTGFAILLPVLILIAVAGLYRHQESRNQQLRDRIALIERNMHAAAAERDVALGKTETAQRVSLAISAWPNMLPILGQVVARLPETMRIESIDLSREGLRASLAVRSPGDAAKIVLGADLLPGVAIQSVQQQTEASFLVDVTAPASTFTTAVAAQ
jgi:hypothetical protein